MMGMMALLMVPYEVVVFTNYRTINQLGLLDTYWALILPSLASLPHPGFPTDMQPQISILQLAAEGTSILTETVFENRFMHLEELRRMNADFKVEGNSVVLRGPTDFNGAEVAATDLRAAAALVLAGLVAKNITQVTNLKYLDRGYYHFHQKLASLGADIKRIDDITDRSFEIKKEKLKNVNNLQ